MVKSQGCSAKTSLRKGLWTPEEDQKLIAYISRYGIWNWSEMPKYAGLLRCGKSCRLRWVNYLRPDIKRGNFTQEENEIIIKLHQELGNHWSAIASRLPGRTDNEIKNHWSTHIMNKRSCKKKIKKKKLASTESLQGTQTAAASRQMQNPPRLLPDPLLPNNPPTSPQLSTDYSSSSRSSSCSAKEIYKIQSSEVKNHGTSSPTFDVLHNVWEQQLTAMDGLCITDCHEATYTDPGFMVSASLWGLEEDYIYPSANSYYDAHDDFWSAF